MNGILFDIQRFSVHDGPGIRTTVFLKGCPLRCAWCQNPEGLNSGMRLWNFNNLCNGCGACVKECHRQALTTNEKRSVHIDHNKCDQCAACVNLCIRNAMAVDGFFMSAEELTDKLLADRVFYISSGGGVTFSGGEPLMQQEFVKSVAGHLKKKGINTAMETSMACSWNTLKSVTAYIDQFIVDLKIADADRHRAATGQDNSGIKENFIRLCECIGHENRLKIRIPLIPGYTDDDANLAALGQFIRRYGRHTRVELINFNPLAAAKYRRMGVANDLWSNPRPFSITEMAQKEAIVERCLKK